MVVGLRICNDTSEWPIVAQAGIAAPPFTQPYYKWDSHIKFDVTNIDPDGNTFGMSIDATKSANTSGAPRGLTVRTLLEHPTGNTPSGANGVDARVTLQDSNTGIAGEMHAMESQCKIEDDTRSVNGTFAAHKFTNYIKAGNTMPVGTYFLRFYDAGTVKTPRFFELTGSTAGTDNMFSTTPSDKTNGAVNATLKVRVAGTDYWIPLWDVKDGS